MKKSLKGTIAAVLATTMMFSTAISVSAITHVPGSGCGSQITMIQCGSYFIMRYEKHYLHTNIYCEKSGGLYNHDRVCAGCGANNGNVGARVCNWSHQYCPPETNVCQY